MTILFKSLIVFGLVYFIIARPLIFKNDNINNISINSNKTHLLGIDVSHDQGEIDWQRVSKSGINFVYHKASDGITYKDPMFDTNVKKINKYKIELGAYHFFEPEDNPHAQVKNFLDSIQGKNLTLVPMVDVEIRRNQNPKIVKENLQKFLTELEQKTGCKAIIYSYGDFWKNNIGEKFNSYPFWLADYDEKMKKPKGLENLLIWQYSQKGHISGIKGYVDLDLILDGSSGLDKLKCNYKKGGDLL